MLFPCIKFIFNVIFGFPIKLFCGSFSISLAEIDSNA